jgi:hypothetical protein
MMFKKFRLFFLAVFCGLLLFSCLKKVGKKELEENLKSAMGLYLNHQRHIDTSRVKFQVLDVVYFEDKTEYICRFQVNMKEKTADMIKDTIGTMSAKISKDFKTVSRNY